MKSILLSLVLGCSATSALATSSAIPVKLYDLRDRQLLSSPGGFDISFHVEAMLQTLSYEKEVAAVWTNDFWQTINVCQLQCLRTLVDGRQIWGGTCGLSNATIADEHGVQLTIAATFGAVTIWDNNHDANYELLSIASPLRGVERTGDTVHRGEHGLLAAVSFRIFPYDGLKSADVIYTINGWQTVQSQSVDLSAAANDHVLFDTQLHLPDDAEELEYVVVYRVNGVEYWDNNTGNNFHVTLR